ncbi:MAG: NUDIX domain-containing protein [Thermoplasmatota archaeon]
MTPSHPPSPRLAADAVLIKGEEVLLVRRKYDPYAGSWAIPGGFVEVGETTEAAAVRELLEETQLRGTIVTLLGVYSDPARDPRGHVVGIAYVCGVAGLVFGIEPKGGDDAADARWFHLDALPPLAFDHAKILADAKAWLLAGGREKLVAATEAC